MYPGIFEHVNLLKKDIFSYTMVMKKIYLCWIKVQNHGI
jgi:hypothetical protein